MFSNTRLLTSGATSVSCPFIHSHNITQFLLRWATETTLCRVSVWNIRDFSKAVSCGADDANAARSRFVDRHPDHCQTHKKGHSLHNAKPDWRRCWPRNRFVPVFQGSLCTKQKKEAVVVWLWWLRSGHRESRINEWNKKGWCKFLFKGCYLQMPLKAINTKHPGCTRMQRYSHK